MGHFGREMSHTAKLSGGAGPAADSTPRLARRAVDIETWRWEYAALEGRKESCPMDKLDRYRDIVRRIIQEYASFKPSHGQIDTEAIIDPERDHYEVMHAGWDDDRRVHGSVVHIDISGGKVWVQYDGTNRPVVEELMAAGIPREDIVLGFHPAELRPLTGFGLAD
jgi:XisI protein